MGPPPSLPSNVEVVSYVSFPSATHTTAFVRFRDPYPKSVFGSTLFEFNATRVLWRDVLRRILKLKPGVVVHVGDVYRADV